MTDHLDSGATNVLVIEDEPSIAEICERVLDLDGLNVDIAPNGKMALTMLGNNSYGLLILDIRIPYINGIELYKWLEETHPQLALRTIITTGSVMSKETIDYIKSTGRPFLPKPFTPRELQAIVRETLALS